MTSPNDLYAALVARYGKDAVDAKLDEMGCKWWPERGLGYELNMPGSEAWAILYNPVALAVLCEVGETMLWESDVKIGRCADMGKGDWEYRTLRYGKFTAKSRYQFATKSAAIIAALGGKE